MIILLVTLFAAAWLSVREERTLLERTRLEQVNAVVQLIGQSAETMLASGELSGLRRMVVHATREHRLGSCQIILPDGHVLVDAQPSKVNMAAIPPSWPQGPLDLRYAPSTGDEIAVTHSLLVPGRGPAMLFVRANIGAKGEALFELIASLGSLGVAGLLALMLLYRRHRKQLTGLGLIREALLSFEAGPASLGALAVSGKLGPEAVAWNELLGEIEKGRRSEATRSLSDKLGQRRETKSALEEACDSLAVGLAILDTHGTVREANGAAATLLGVKREELIGYPFAGFVTDASLRSALQSAIESGWRQTRRLELTRQEQGIASVLRLSIRPMRKDDAGAGVVIIEDITQSCAADAARNAFVTQASHELRTPLTNMRLCLEGAMDDEDPADRAKCFNVLNQETRRLERMVSEMLSVAEIEAGAIKLRVDDVRLDSVFEELKSDFESLAKEKRIDLVFELPPKFPVMQADRNKLALALHNLVGNAIKYTPAGGRVTISLRVERDRITVEVVDSGIGIKDEETELVFEKFYRAKDPRVAKISGSGLGLTLSRQVARLHGGDVTLQSQFNRGSTFTLVVPMVSKAA
jgi:PAS domain S-box-containing protein